MNKEKNIYFILKNKLRNKYIIYIWLSFTISISVSQSIFGILILTTFNYLYMIAFHKMKYTPCDIVRILVTPLIAVVLYGLSIIWTGLTQKVGYLLVFVDGKFTRDGFIYTYGIFFCLSVTSYIVEILTEEKTNS